MTANNEEITGPALPSLSRRDFVDGLGLAGFGVVLGFVSPVAAQPPEAAAAPTMETAAAMPGQLFFTDREAALVEALVDRLIPSEGEGPGAIEAGVPNYLDKQLGGAMGAGERLFLGGPFKPDAAPQFGYQLSFNPAEMVRRALKGLDDKTLSAGRSFTDLSPAERDAVIRDGLEGGGLGDLDGVPAKVFFKELLDYTVQGYFCDPAYGGNRDMVAWKAIGFPGAYAAFADTIERHGQPFEGGPISMHDHGDMPMADMVSMERQR